MIYLINLNEKDMLDNAGDRVPIGLLSIGTYLHNKGIETKIWDLNHDSENEMFNQMEKDNLTTIGISVYTSAHYKESIRLANKFPKDIRKIAGGHHANALPYSLSRYFDSIVIGEGENTILRAINENGIITGERVNLNRLSRLNRNLVDMSRYGISSEHRTATMITSRGCPYGCSFCGNYLKEVRFHPVEQITEDIKELEDEGFDSIYFLDDLFTANRKRLEQIVSNVSLPFRATTRANLLDDQKGYTLGQNGCEWLNIGVESGNDEILNKINKRENTATIERAVKIATKNGIKTKGFFIIGLPGETEQTAHQTIDFSLHLRDLGLRQADFYYLVPYPGTAIWKNPKEFGIKIIDRDFTKYMQIGPKAKCVIETESLSSKRIEEIVEEAKEQWKK